MPAGLLMEVLLRLLKCLLRRVSHTTDLNELVFQVNRCCSSLRKTFRQEAARDIGKHTLMSIGGNSDRDPCFLFGSSDSIGVTYLSHVWKVESKGDCTRVGIDASPVEVRRCTKMPLKDVENPVLIGPG